jgi:hypothetical protein
MFSLFTVTRTTSWIPETWSSLVDQGRDFEWVVGLRPGTDPAGLPSDPRIQRVDLSDVRGTGDAKERLCAAATGRFLVDLAPGDVVAEGALAKLEAAFADPAVGFVAGDEAWRGAVERPGVRTTACEIRGRRLTTTASTPLGAHALCHVQTLPRGLRAWRDTTYDAVGGFDATLPAAAEYDLVCRTYLHTRCVQLPEPLCIVRPGVDDPLVTPDVQRLCGDGANNRYPSAGQPVPLRDKYLHELVARQADLAGLPRFDIGGGIYGAPGWKTLDVSGAPDVQWDVFGSKRLPFEDGTIGAFRAFDFFEHGEDMDAFWMMDEIHRCLAPGGWLISYTPHALGIGASCDPSHRSRWDERRFLYWCSDELRPFLVSAYPKATARFHPGRLLVERRIMGPAPWRFEVPYVVADLMKL